jgi:hypothetical protein
MARREHDATRGERRRRQPLPEIEASTSLWRRVARPTSTTQLAGQIDRLAEVRPSIST